MSGRNARLLSLAWRESRTARRRLLLYMSSISLGVAALVAIDSFAANVTDSVRDQSRALLGGDASLTSGDRYSPKVVRVLDSLQRRGIGESRSTNFASMALVPRSGGTRLVQVRAVSAGYPFYGQITSDPASAWPALQNGPNIVVDPALLVSLDARVGDTVTLGMARFTITGTLKSVPGEVGISATIGPRVYIPERYLEQTRLLVFGSRADYETLFRLANGTDQAKFAADLRRAITGERARVRTVKDTEINLTQAIDQLRDFLGVVGLVALLLGGIGVASGVHAFVMRKIDTVAVLRCLGATSWQVLGIYVVQAAMMGLIGAVLGGVLGIFFQLLLPFGLKDFLPVDVAVHLAPASIGLGLIVGVWVALVFALRPLVAIRRVSPLQALRREADAIVLRLSRLDPLRVGVSLAILASVVLLALTRAGNVRRGIGFSVAIMLAVGALFGSAVLLSLLARKLVRPRWPFVLRQGIASLYRPGNQTRSVVLSLGFGVFLMSTLYQVHHSLLKTLDLKLTQARANLVFFDVQQDQETGIDSIIRANGYAIVQQVPLVTMRVAAINGHTSAQLMGDTVARTTNGRRERRSGWPLRREYRSTYRDEMTPSERLVEGKWFTPTTDTTTLPEVSMEVGVARELRLKIGDTVTWNVQGVQVPTRVTSFREVNWARFEPNFFAVFQTRALHNAPRQFVILSQVPGASAVARVQRGVVRTYPNVSSIDLTLVQRTVMDVLGKVTMAIRFMALVSLALGIPVLFSAVAATRRERLREGVLLKTLGATRRQIGRIMLAEYAVLGALGSLAGVALSFGGSWALTHWIFHVAFAPSVIPVLLVALAMVLLAVTIGVATGREVFRQTPMVALREA
ncbi:MAG TPA: FtsX-like permease family protein [Gemmatimonadaceae bacterium]|nr:FtsX-like permease family protein [Gemmatimonadaceae bacterium]